jgi:hypothetical protein
MEWIRTKLFGDLRTRNRKQINIWESKCRVHEREIDIDINDSRRRQCDLQKKLEKARRENRPEQVDLYSTWLASARVHERRMEQGKVRITNQVEMVKEQASLMVAARSAVEVNALLKQMQNSMVDVKQLINASRDANIREMKNEVVSDLIDTKKDMIDEEVENEKARILMDDPCIEVKVRQGVKTTTATPQEIDIEKRLSKI